MRLAPYVYSWGNRNPAYSISSLVDAYSKFGVTYATIAFIVSGVYISDTQIGDMFIKDIKDYIKMGGTPILSFGGAAGTYVEEAMDDEALFNFISDLLKKTGIWSIDWDIEGASLPKTWLTTKRNKCINRLQKTFPGLYVSFTLPVMPDGLTWDGVTFMDQVKKDGVTWDICNLMTMNYGVPSMNGKSHGQCAIQAAMSVMTQVGCGSNKIGICPMIGVNDDGTTFGLSDAKMVADYVYQNGVGLISYWAFQRDQPGSGNLGLYSGVNKGLGDFFIAFNNGVGTPAPTPKPPVPAPVPGPQPVPSFTCPNCYKGLKLNLELK